jgi:hypothetical protein
MARGDRGTISRRRLWRRHRQNREAIEVHSQQGKAKLADINDGVWADGSNAAANMGVNLRTEGRVWKLPTMQLGDLVLKTSYRIKVVSDGSWWQIQRTNLRSSSHFEHCLAERLEEDG